MNHRFHPVAALLALALGAGLAPAGATTPAEQLAAYSAQAGVGADPARGLALFTQDHGHELRCASCHGEVPLGGGRHASTGKPIAPMAPAANGERFTDAGKTEKWFRRNCNDVLGRACSPGEKADVLAWLLTLKP